MKVYSNFCFVLQLWWSLRDRNGYHLDPYKGFILCCRV